MIKIISGSVFPSGCHRHPSKLMLNRHGFKSHSHGSSSGHFPYNSSVSSSGSAQLLSFRHNLESCHSENSTLNRLDINVSVEKTLNRGQLKLISFKSLSQKYYFITYTNICTSNFKTLYYPLILLHFSFFSHLWYSKSIGYYLGHLKYLIFLIF